MDTIPSRTPRLYHETVLHTGGSLTLSPAQTHYLVHVLRLKKGDTIKVFNGADGEWSAQLTQLSKKGGAASCQAPLRAAWAPHDVWLVFSPLKKDRLDMLVEKAAEFGAAQLMPVLFQRTAVRRLNSTKIGLQLIEATEQSDNFSIPNVTPLQPLPTLLSVWPPERRLYVCHERAPTNPTLLDALDAQLPAGFLIGPEGGITPEEIALLQQYSFVRWVTLGRATLRAETAAISALSLYHHKASS